MAIKNLFGRGIGLTGGLIKWVVTRGYDISIPTVGALTRCSGSDAARFTAAGSDAVRYTAIGSDQGRTKASGSDQ